MPPQYPAIVIKPDGSTDKALPSSKPVPPMFSAQTYSPLALYFAKKTSSPPEEIKLLIPVPGSKSAVDSNEPVIYTSPAESTPIPLP